MSGIGDLVVSVYCHDRIVVSIDCLYSVFVFRFLCLRSFIDDVLDRVNVLHRVQS